MARTAIIEAPGGPEQFRIVDREVGRPRTGEIRIRHEACGLNFIDVYQRTGLYPLEMPHALGMEAAGVVEAVGEGVTHLKEGDRAAYAAAPPGAYTEARVMNAAQVCPLPDGISIGGRRGDDAQGADDALPVPPHDADRRAIPSCSMPPPAVSA
jgi:NADPH2:quinone reductase